MKILAIDQGTNCGWCCDDQLYGVWNLSTSKDESMGMKLVRFKVKLKEILEAEKIELVRYERVASRFATAAIHAAKMVGIIEAMCTEMDIEYDSVSAGELKKWATKNGAAKKPEMIRAARDRFGYDGKDDNEADAILMYQMAKEKYGKV